MTVVSDRRQRIYILCVIASVSLFFITSAKLTINYIQENYYRANKFQLEAEWMDYEQPKGCVESSIEGIKTKTKDVAISALADLIYGVTAIGLIWCVDIKGGKERTKQGLSWALELILAIHLGYVSFYDDSTLIQGFLVWSVLILGSFLIILLLSYFFIRLNALSLGEVIVYGSILINILNLIAFYFFSDDVHRMNGIDSLTKCEDIDQSLKDQIIKLCSENGISTKHIFLNDSPGVNACAISNNKTKSLIINRKSLEKLPANILAAQILHEIGHIAHKHMLHLTVFLLTAQIIYLLTSFVTYRLALKYYTGPPAIYSTFFVLLLVKAVLLYIENVGFRWPMEYDADLYAIKKGYDKETETLMCFYGQATSGVYFDYLSWFGGMYFAHPPLYKRAHLCKNYIGDS